MLFYADSHGSLVDSHGSHGSHVDSHDSLARILYILGISQVAIIISMLNLPMCKKIARNTVLKVPMTGEGLIIEHFI